MSSTWVILNCLIVLISCLLAGINGANSTNGSCVINVHVTYKFYLCLDNKYYECYPNNNNNNNNASNGGNVVNVSTNASSSGSNSGSNSGSIYSQLTFISYFNQNNLLEKAGCNYISNHCPSSNGLVTLNCKSNTSQINSASVSTGSSGTNCVVNQTNSNGNSNQLICSMVINANNKDYLYAFIAVIIIVIVLFCLCPICCIYHFCRYCQENEFYQSYHGRENKKCNYNNNNNNNAKHTTSNISSNKRSSKCAGDNSYEDRAVLFSTVSKRKVVTTEQQLEAQPINNSNCSVSRDGFSNTNANAEVVV